ncbi:uncharacterized protein METZ01_LOCUS339899, partial [marine metagenome]
MKSKYFYKRGSLVDKKHTLLTRLFFCGRKAAHGGGVMKNHLPLIIDL